MKTNKTRLYLILGGALITSVVFVKFVIWGKDVFGPSIGV